MARLFSLVRESNRAMLQFFIRRLAVLIPTFIGVSIIAFAFIRMLPGDPVQLMAGERVISAERHAELS